MKFRCAKIEPSQPSVFENSWGSISAHAIGFSPKVSKSYYLEFDFHDVFRKGKNLFMVNEIGHTGLPKNLIQIFSTLVNSEKTHARVSNGHNFILGTLSELDENFVSAFFFLETVCLVSLEPGSYSAGKCILMANDVSVFNIEY